MLSFANQIHGLSIPLVPYLHRHKIRGRKTLTWVSYNFEMHVLECAVLIMLENDFNVPKSQFLKFRNLIAKPLCKLISLHLG